MTRGTIHGMDIEVMESEHIMARRNPLTGAWLVLDKRPGKDNFEFWALTKREVKRVIKHVDKLEGKP